MFVVGTSPECRNTACEKSVASCEFLSFCRSLCVMFPSSGLLMNTVETYSYKKQLPGVQGEITLSENLRVLVSHT